MAKPKPLLSFKRAVILGALFFGGTIFVNAALRGFISADPLPASQRIIAQQLSDEDSGGFPGGLAERGAPGGTVVEPKINNEDEKLKEVSNIQVCLETPINECSLTDEGGAFQLASTLPNTAEVKLALRDKDGRESNYQVVALAKTDDRPKPGSKDWQKVKEPSEAMTVPGPIDNLHLQVVEKSEYLLAAGDIGGEVPVKAKAGRRAYNLQRKLDKLKRENKRPKRQEELAKKIAQLGSLRAPAASGKLKGSEQTAEVINGFIADHPNQLARVAALGDLAYPSGTAKQFLSKYDPAWGPGALDFTPGAEADDSATQYPAKRVLFVPGNHEFYKNGGFAEPSPERYRQLQEEGKSKGAQWGQAYYRYGQEAGAVVGEKDSEGNVLGWYFVDTDYGRIITLNLNCQAPGVGDCKSPSSAQAKFLIQALDGARDKGYCTVVLAHHTFFSTALEEKGFKWGFIHSGDKETEKLAEALLLAKTLFKGQVVDSPHGTNRDLETLFQIIQGQRFDDEGERASEAGGKADVLLTAHTHGYENFYRMNGKRASDLINQLDHGGGTQVFVVGTGGNQHFNKFEKKEARGEKYPTSRAVISKTYGVLALELGPDWYSWQFVSPLNSQGVEYQVRDQPGEEDRPADPDGDGRIKCHNAERAAAPKEDLVVTLKAHPEDKPSEAKEGELEAEKDQKVTLTWKITGKKRPFRIALEVGEVIGEVIYDSERDGETKKSHTFSFDGQARTFKAEIFEGGRAVKELATLAIKEKKALEVELFATSTDKEGNKKEAKVTGEKTKTRTVSPGTIVEVTWKVIKGEKPFVISELGGLIIYESQNAAYASVKNYSFDFTGQPRKFTAFETDQGLPILSLYTLMIEESRLKLEKVVLDPPKVEEKKEDDVTVKLSWQFSDPEAAKSDDVALSLLINNQPAQDQPEKLKGEQTLFLAWEGINREGKHNLTLQLKKGGELLDEKPLTLEVTPAKRLIMRVQVGAKSWFRDTFNAPVRAFSHGLGGVRVTLIGPNGEICRKVTRRTGQQATDATVLFDNEDRDCRKMTSDQPVYSVNLAMPRYVPYYYFLQVPSGVSGSVVSDRQVVLNALAPSSSEPIPLYSYNVAIRPAIVGSIESKGPPLANGAPFDLCAIHPGVALNIPFLPLELLLDPIFEGLPIFKTVRCHQYFASTKGGYTLWPFANHVRQQRKVILSDKLDERKFVSPPGLVEVNPYGFVEVPVLQVK